MAYFKSSKFLKKKGNNLVRFFYQNKNNLIRSELIVRLIVRKNIKIFSRAYVACVCPAIDSFE